eukprot:4781388-Prymnesium_polylepis.1
MPNGFESAAWAHGARADEASHVHRREVGQAERRREARRKAWRRRQQRAHLVGLAEEHDGRRRRSGGESGGEGARGVGGGREGAH